MKKILITFLVFFASTANSTEIGESNLPGLYRAKYLGSEYYLAEIEFLKDGSLKYRDEQIKGMPMPKPGCSGTWTFDGDRVLTSFSCSEVNGPSKVWHTWYFKNSTLEELNSEVGAVFELQSSLYPHRILPFRFHKVDSPVFD